MWPKLTNIDDKIYNRILEKSQPQVASTLNAWIRVFSGAVVGGKSGLILASNSSYDLFRAAGQSNPSIYGTDVSNGIIGVSWDGKAVGGGADRGYRPMPLITGFDSQEGKDQISREASLQIKCFSLYQLEYLQKYLMEPGYSLCIEWGWNSSGAGKNLINSKAGVDGILKQATDANLDTDTLHKKRVSSQGDYDTYLGFIVGCSIKSEGENFILDIKMKGSPSLPTFMQSHTKIQKTDKNGKIIEPESVAPYGDNELIEGGTNVTARRFKKMFNNLPAHRQLKQVKELLSSARYYDFVGFDAVVQDQIDEFHDGGEWYKIGDGGTEVEVEGVDVKKDGLISDKKFIRMEFLVKILNANGALESIKMGNKEITFEININNTVIGAFPKIFSTDSSKLIIPGEIPDFSTYYLSTAKVEQGDDGELKGVDGNPAVDTSAEFGGKSFTEARDLNELGLKEKARYWGLLKNLYVNFDVFKSALESKNKTLREVFTDILNDCSSAVNSFWNFQIKDEVIGNKVVLTVFDENWIGSKPDEVPAKQFYHSGYKSPFLDATLDMSIPANMVSQIVSRRLSYATNPQEPLTGIGSFFSAEKDLFIKNAADETGGGDTTPPPAEPEKKESERLAEEGKNQQAIMDNADAEISKLEAQYREYSKNFSKTHSYREVQEDIRKRGKPGHPTYDITQKVEEQKKIKNDARTARNTANNSIRQAKQNEADAEKAALSANLNANLEKLTIIPKPNLASIGDLGNDSITKKESAMAKFGFYTFKDEGYFDRLRNNAFSAKSDNSSPRLSHPLPIKYSFTILGTSGIRRGDMFNINGIPAIYTKKGLFQVINVSHQLDGMSWKTTVEGQYRQIEKRLTEEEKKEKE